MPTDLVLAGALNAATFRPGEVVHISANRFVSRAQANLAANIKGAVGVSVGDNFVFGGVQRVLLVPGLVLAAGDVLFVSATTPGRATNVMPALAKVIGTIFDATQYAIDGTVRAVINDAGSAAATTGVQFEPARVMHVSPQWPVGVDTARYFTTVASAVTAASALVPAPSQASPVWVYIYPGNFVENITLPSFVYLRGVTANSWNLSMYGVATAQGVVGPTINGVTWTPVAATNEVAHVEGLQLSFLTSNVTGKGGGNAVFDASGCSVGSFSSGLIGRGNETFYAKNCFFTGLGPLFTSFAFTQFSDCLMSQGGPIIMASGAGAQPTFTRELDLRNVDAAGGVFGAGVDTDTGINIQADTSLSTIVIVARHSPIADLTLTAGTLVGSIFDVWGGGSLLTITNSGIGFHQVTDTTRAWQLPDTVIQLNASGADAIYQLPPIDQVPGCYIDFQRLNGATGHNAQIQPSGTDQIGGVNANYNIALRGQSFRLLATQVGGTKNWLPLFVGAALV